MPKPCKNSLKDPSFLFHQLVMFQKRMFKGTGVGGSCVSARSQSSTGAASSSPGSLKAAHFKAKSFSIPVVISCAWFLGFFQEPVMQRVRECFWHLVLFPNDGWPSISPQNEVCEFVWGLTLPLPVSMPYWLSVQWPVVIKIPIDTGVAGQHTCFQASQVSLNSRFLLKAI